MGSGQMDSIDAPLTMLAGQYLHIASVCSLPFTVHFPAMLFPTYTYTFSGISFFILHCALIIVTVNL